MNGNLAGEHNLRAKYKEPERSSSLLRCAKLSNKSGFNSVKKWGFEPDHAECDVDYSECE